MAEVTLRRGGLELVLAPEQGGCVQAFRRGAFDVLHASQGEPGRNHTCFPLVPYSGRVDHARFAFGGREHRLEPNYPPEPHSIHGHGWSSAWEVAASGEDSATLALRHDDGGAFRYEAEQRFALGDDLLEIGLAVTHRGDEPMPYGLGLHPYFDQRPGVLLSAEVSGIWVADGTNIPRRLEPVPIERGFRLRRDVAELAGTDHNFQGWSGTARLDWPDLGLALVMEADPVFRHLIVYVPKGKPYFCVEPASMVADGFNMLARGVEGTGVRVLGPGERLEGAVRFRLVPAAGVPS
jgi:aldose 1-epimerase